MFINGIATEVGKGPLDMKAMFGDGGLMLFHSSGLAVEVNDHGFLLQGLQHGESYFLVIISLNNQSIIVTNSNLAFIIKCNKFHYTGFDVQSPNSFIQTSWNDLFLTYCGFEIAALIFSKRNLSFSKWYEVMISSLVFWWMLIKW